MGPTVNLVVQQATASRLQQLSVLAGSIDAAISRLIDHWERSHKTTEPGATSRTVAETWQSHSGDTLPVGTKLEANYRDNTYYARVERNGIRFGEQIYSSPSAAATAVKATCGVTGLAARTDGRKFWKIRDPIKGTLVSIATLHASANIDVEQLLSELDALGPKSAA